MTLKHRKFVASLGCTICAMPAQCAHVRYSDAAAGKVNPGTSRRPDDVWTVPLCQAHHIEQHAGGERAFWEKYRIDPVPLARAIFRVSGNRNAAMLEIAKARS